MNQNQNNVGSPSPANGHDHTEMTTRLLTEVACCTIEVHNDTTDVVQVCETAIGYLAKDNPELLTNFIQTKDTTLQNEDADYIMKQYDGKSDDLRIAVRLLETLAKAPNASAEEKEIMSKAARLLVDFYDMDIKDSLYFITEQACTLIQAQGSESKHLTLCERAMEFMSKGDAEKIKVFNNKTLTIKHDPDADYDIEDYDGKKTDIRHAVADIMSLANSPETPAELKEVLTKVADGIADFYGVADAA